MSSVRIIPLLDRILVRKLKPIEKTAAGIYIPEKAQSSLNRGQVIAVGPGSEENKVTLKPGDQVVLPSFGGAKIEDGEAGLKVAKEEELFLYRESEILAKIEA